MMNPEDSMRDRITAELETTRPPLGDLVARSVAEARRKRRRARIGAGAVSAVGVLAVAGAVAQFAPSSAATAHDTGSGSGAAPGVHPTATTPTKPSPTAPRGTSSSPKTADSTDPTDPTAPTAPTSPSSATTTKLPVSSIVQHVNPGPVTLAKGFYLSYSTSSMSWWTYEGGLTMQYNGSNTWGSDFVGGGISDRLVTGMYVGDKDIAAASMTVDGTVYPATVVKVNGSQGWCGLYVLRPAGVTTWNTFRINVYDTSGALVATSFSGEITGTPPSSLPTSQPTGHPNGTLPYTNIPLGAPFPGATIVPPSEGGK
ncbi:hypothetical protein ABH935_008990 [Catenulispora sp. GAS73]|uniref:hypothetical protein n=1 Tax=Catenulispora sp. GAS73 TaxID=3156269 RepID=UPI00351264AE